MQKRQLYKIKSCWLHNMREINYPGSCAPRGEVGDLLSLKRKMQPGAQEQSVLSVEGGEVGVPLRDPLLSVSQTDQEQNPATGRAGVAGASGLCSGDPSPRKPRAHAPRWECSERRYICMLSVHSATSTAGSFRRPGLCGSPMSVPLLVTPLYQDEPILLMCIFTRF